jgi:hypothetical protein
MMMMGGYVLQPPLVMHVTALGGVVICEEGARVQRYVIDYFVRPAFAPSAYLTTTMFNFLSKGYPEDCQEAPLKKDHPLYSFLSDVDEESTNFHTSLLDYFSQLFNRPILDPDSLEGCPHCLVASELRKESELAVHAVRDWDRRELSIE